MPEYSEEQIQEMIENEKQKWQENELKPIQQEKENLQSQVEELKQYKPEEKSEEQKAIEQKEQEIFEKEKNLYLKEQGLEDFAELIGGNNMDEIKQQAEKVNNVLKERTKNNSYVPTERKQQNEKYNQYEKQGNTVGMIGAKLSNLFNG